MGYPITQATLHVRCEGESDDPILIRNYVLALHSTARLLESCGDAAALESARITVYGGPEGIAAQVLFNEDRTWSRCPSPIVFHVDSGISFGFSDDWVLQAGHTELPTWLDLRSYEGGW